VPVVDGIEEIMKDFEVLVAQTGSLLETRVLLPYDRGLLQVTQRFRARTRIALA
jgi:hypothetical protein